MANRCWNSIRFNGSDEALNGLYDKLLLKVEEGLFIDSYQELFLTEKPAFNDFPKWFYPEKPYFENGSLFVQGESAWGPVISLVQMLCESYRLSGSISWDEPGARIRGTSEFNEVGKLIASSGRS